MQEGFLIIEPFYNNNDDQLGEKIYDQLGETKGYDQHGKTEIYDQLGETKGYDQLGEKVYDQLGGTNRLREVPELEVQT